jgi:tripartite ATP-independent transporter DctP family solute receptor
MKRIGSGLVVVAVICAVLGVGAQVALAQSPVVIKLSHTIPEGQPIAQAAQEFKRLVEQNSQGGITVQVFPYNQLGGENEVIQQVRQGTIQMSVDSASTLGNVVPLVGVMDAPYVWTDYPTLVRVTSGPLFDPIRADLVKAGIRLMATHWYYGTRELTAHKLIMKPEDATGLKIRTPPSPTNLLAGRVLGGNPVPLDPQQLYLALKQKVVDAQENPLSFIYATKLYEVQAYIILTNHILQSQVVLMNQKFWDGLKPEQQKVIADAVAAAGDYDVKLTRENDEKMLAMFDHMNGVTLVKDPDIAAFRARAAALVPESKLPWVGLYGQIKALEK